MNLLSKISELGNIQSEIQSKKKEIEEYEKKLWQIKNREKKLRKMISNEERRMRTHRLIERGAILESFIGNANELSNEEIKNILMVAFQNERVEEKIKSIKESRLIKDD